MKTSSFTHIKSTEASELISHACNRLGLPRQISVIAQEAAFKIAEVGVAAGRSPLSITSACIYLISHLMGQALTPKQIAEVAGVSDGTIGTAYWLIRSALDQIIEEEWLRRGGERSKVPPT